MKNNKIYLQHGFSNFKKNVKIKFMPTHNGCHQLVDLKKLK